FSAVNAVLLRPLPYGDPHRLVLLNEETRLFSGMSVSWANYVDWRDQNRSFEPLAAVQPAQLNLTGMDRPEHLGGWNVTHNFFPALGVRPFLGRDFQPEDDRAGARPVVLLGYGLFQKRFGADAGVVGRTVTIDGRPSTIVGVLPASFRFYYGDTDVFRPIGLRRALGAGRRRLLRQVLAESSLLALLGGGSGLLLAAWLTDLLLAMVPAGMPRINEVRLDAPVLGFTLVLSLATGLLFGL